VKMNTAAVQAGAQISAENALTLQKILLFVSGQQEPGLKVPGISDRMDAIKKQMEEAAVDNAKQIASLQTSVSDLKTADTARKGWVAGAFAALGLLGTGGAIYFYDFLHKLYLIVQATPLK
jgi:hypothetical protein